MHDLKSVANRDERNLGEQVKDWPGKLGFESTSLHLIKIGSLDRLLASGTDALLAEAHKRDLFTGLSTGIVTGGECYLHTVGDGIDSDCHFEIGSTTKTFTSELLSALVDHGALSWQQPIVHYLPSDLRIHPRSYKKLSQIRLIDVATHCSGMPLLPPNLRITDGANPYRDYSDEDLLQYLTDSSFTQSNIKGFNYSNVGFSVLGYIAGRAYGSNYADALISEVINRLGLANTGLALTGSQLPALIPGYTKTGKPTPRWTQLAFAPAGGLCTTAGDMLRWIRYLLARQDRTPLQRYSVSKSQSIGLGWMIDPRSGFFERDGMTGGFCSYLSVHPQQQHGIVILSNRQSLSFVRAFAKNIEHSLQGQPMFPLNGDYGRLRAQMIEFIRSKQWAVNAVRTLRSYLR